MSSEMAIASPVFPSGRSRRVPRLFAPASFPGRFQCFPFARTASSAALNEIGLTALAPVRVSPHPQSLLPARLPGHSRASCSSPDTIRTEPRIAAPPPEWLESSLANLRNPRCSLPRRKTAGGIDVVNVQRNRLDIRRLHSQPRNGLRSSGWLWPDCRGGPARTVAAFAVDFHQKLRLPPEIPCERLLR